METADHLGQGWGGEVVGEELYSELVQCTDRAREWKRSVKQCEETAGDGHLGFWFASKCLTQMDMAFGTRRQTQLLIKTNTKQHSDNSEREEEGAAADQAEEGRAVSPPCQTGRAGGNEMKSRPRKSSVAFQRK